MALDRLLVRVDTCLPPNAKEGRPMTPLTWERLWRSSGISFVVFFVIAYIVFGDQPGVGASADKLVSFYDGDRTRILVATVIFGIGVLNLLWFAAALSSVLRDAGQGGWGRRQPPPAQRSGLSSSC